MIWVSSAGGFQAATFFSHCSNKSRILLAESGSNVRMLGARDERRRRHLLDQVMGREMDGSHISDKTQNSDLQTEIAQSLEHCGHPGLRRVSVEVDNQCIILSGTVPSYYMKQIAQETARQACSGRKVYNDLDVTPVESVGN